MRNGGARVGFMGQKKWKNFIVVGYTKRRTKVAREKTPGLRIFTKRLPRQKENLAGKEEGIRNEWRGTVP